MGSQWSLAFRPDRARLQQADWSRTCKWSLLPSCTVALHIGVRAWMAMGSSPQFMIELELCSGGIVVTVTMYLITVLMTLCRSHSTTTGSRVTRELVTGLAKSMARSNERGWDKNPREEEEGQTGLSCKVMAARSMVLMLEEDHWQQLETVQNWRKEPPGDQKQQKAARCDQTMSWFLLRSCRPTLDRA
eukprot:2287200-Amphidinium_carterae.3